MNDGLRRFYRKSHKRALEGTQKIFFWLGFTMYFLFNTKCTSHRNLITRYSEEKMMAERYGKK
jgi:hypothetical protein